MEAIQGQNICHQEMVTQDFVVAKLALLTKRYTDKDENI